MFKQGDKKPLFAKLDPIITDKRKNCPSARKDYPDDIAVKFKFFSPFYGENGNYLEQFR